MKVKVKAAIALPERKQQRPGRAKKTVPSEDRTDSQSKDARDIKQRRTRAKPIKHEAA